MLVHMLSEKSLTARDAVSTPQYLCMSWVLYTTHFDDGYRSMRVLQLLEKI